MLATFLATLYRIYIEKEQIKTTQKNVEATQKLRTVKEAIEREKDMILELKDGKEFYELLKCLFDEA